MTDQIESPCIGVCQLDSNQVCTGCFRTIDEIIAWPAADLHQRQLILHRSCQRRPPETTTR